jgi:hypothetical protein
MMTAVILIPGGDGTQSALLMVCGKFSLRESDPALPSAAYAASRGWCLPLGRNDSEEAEGQTLVTFDDMAV